VTKFSTVTCHGQGKVESFPQPKGNIRQKIFDTQSFNTLHLQVSYLAQQINILVFAIQSH